MKTARLIVANSQSDSNLLYLTGFFAPDPFVYFEVAGKKFLVMSETAYKSLNENQVSAIEKYCEIIYSDLNTIEVNGGGSARCMLAEVFLPKK